ncbi:hypothetical protein M5689_024141 [Euphorbia peplus]|nr:hypothetical protein M5689_024141 [Euphorbia peplus]
MLSSARGRRSKRSKNVQSHQTTFLDDSSIIEQEKNMTVRRKPGRPRKLIPRDINCQQQLLNAEPIETQHACSSIAKPTDMVVRRKPGRPRRSIPKEINCQQELLNTKLKDMFVRGKPGRPRRLVLEEVEGQNRAVSSSKQERDMVVVGRKCRTSTDTSEENCNKKGKYAQVNYQIEGSGEPSDFMKENDNVWDGEVNHAIWSGSISIPRENFSILDGLEAYMSSRAGVEVVDAVQQLPVLLDAQVLSRLDVWPARFHECPPTLDIIDFCLVPANERSQDVFDSLLDAITREDAVLKAVYDGVSILIFSSLQLAYPNWTAMFGKYYLWAVFEGKDSFFPHCQEENFSKLNLVCHVPVSYLTNEVQPVTENEDLGERESCIRQETGTTQVRSFQKHRRSADVEVESESIGASVLEMAKLFHDPACPEEQETSSAYNVEPKYAQTLRAILDKHGDITQSCVIKCPKLVACALERVCASVEDLKNIRFVDLRRSHLEFMHSVISDAEVMQLDVKWLRNKHEELVEAIEKMKEQENMKERRKEVKNRVAVKEHMISWKEDKMVKLQGEIEKLKSEIAEATQEKERLSNEITNVTSKCKYLSQNSLVEGLF